MQCSEIRVEILEAHTGGNAERLSFIDPINYVELA